MAREFWAIDCETDPFKFGRVPEPFLWGAYNDGTYLEFGTTNEFAEWAKRQQAVIYAHNGGKFDFHFLNEFMDPYEELLVIDGRITAFRFGAAEFRDSFSISVKPKSSMTNLSGTSEAPI